MKRKIITVVLSILAAISFITIFNNGLNNKKVEATRLHRYTIPARYCGHWQNKKHKWQWINITKHTICGEYLSKYLMTTYHGSNALNMRMKPSTHYYLAWRGGKNLWFCCPGGEESNVYRSGSKLKFRVDTWTMTLQRR